MKTRKCKKCGEVLYEDNFPKHYDWCYDCLKIKAPKYIHRMPHFTGEGRFCKKCGIWKPINDFDSRKWIYEYPNYKHTICKSCRNENRTKYFIRKEEAKEKLRIDNIIKHEEFRKWKWHNDDGLTKLVKSTGMSRWNLYDQKELVELTETHIRLKKLLKTKV